ncbi:MAG: ABC transporter substrate-binding protein, partial [Oscillospiraceae bacterium]
AWNDVDSSESLAMGCLVARKDFLESNPAAIKNFLKEYKDSIKATEDLEKVAPLTVKYDILPSDKIAKLSIPNCNLVYIDGKDMMLKANNYFKVLFESNPVSIGGQMPNEDLFFVQ